jgi:hypothetical protein
VPWSSRRTATQTDDGDDEADDDRDDLCGGQYCWQVGDLRQCPAEHQCRGGDFEIGDRRRGEESQVVVQEVRAVGHDRTRPCHDRDDCHALGEEQSRSAGVDGPWGQRCSALIGSVGSEPGRLGRQRARDCRVDDREHVR